MPGHLRTGRHLRHVQPMGWDVPLPEAPCKVDGFLAAVLERHTSVRSLTFPSSSSRTTSTVRGLHGRPSGTGLLGCGTGLFLPVLIVCCFAGTGTRFPGVRLLALPVFHKRPWPLRRSRGDGNGRPLLPYFLRHSMCVRADLAALYR